MCLLVWTVIRDNKASSTQTTRRPRHDRKRCICTGTAALQPSDILVPSENMPKSQQRRSDNWKRDPEAEPLQNRWEVRPVVPEFPAVKKTTFNLTFNDIQPKPKHDHRLYNLLFRPHSNISDSWAYCGLDLLSVWNALLIEVRRPLGVPLLLDIMFTIPQAVQVLYSWRS